MVGALSRMNGSCDGSLFCWEVHGIHVRANMEAYLFVILVQLGYDAVVINMLMHGLLSGGVVRNVATTEMWNWGQVDITVAATLSDALMQKVSQRSNDPMLRVYALSSAQFPWCFNRARCSASLRLKHEHLTLSVFLE